MLTPLPTPNTIPFHLLPRVNEDYNTLSVAVSGRLDARLEQALESAPHYERTGDRDLCQFFRVAFILDSSPRSAQLEVMKALDRLVDLTSPLGKWLMLLVDVRYRQHPPMTSLDFGSIPYKLPGTDSVWRAIDTRRRCIVAVKAAPVYPSWLSAAILQEVSVLRAARHPRILEVFDVGRLQPPEHPVERPLAFTMPYAELGTLACEAATGHFASPERAAILVASLAEAVCHLHSGGILHRDIKFDNVFLFGNDYSVAVPKLGDCNLASQLPQRGIGSLVATGSEMGSPRWRAPELALGRHFAIGPAIDVYGLGALLFALTTPQRQPPPDYRQNAMDHASRQALLARSLASTAPGLRELILACLAEFPEDRPEAEELARRLRHWSKAPGPLCSTQPENHGSVRLQIDQHSVSPEDCASCRVPAGEWYAERFSGCNYPRQLAAVLSRGSHIFCGQDNHQRQLLSVLGPGCIAWVSGPPGSGKTRLVAETLRRIGETALAPSPGLLFTPLTKGPDTLIRALERSCLGDARPEGTPLALRTADIATGRRARVRSWFDRQGPILWFIDAADHLLEQSDARDLLCELKSSRSLSDGAVILATRSAPTIDQLGDDMGSRVAIVARLHELPAEPAIEFLSNYVSGDDSDAKMGARAVYEALHLSHPLSEADEIFLPGSIIAALGRPTRSYSVERVQDCLLEHATQTRVSAILKESGCCLRAPSASSEPWAGMAIAALFLLCPLTIPLSVLASAGLTTSTVSALSESGITRASETGLCLQDWAFDVLRDDVASELSALDCLRVDQFVSFIESCCRAATCEDGDADTCAAGLLAMSDRLRQLSPLLAPLANALSQHARSLMTFEQHACMVRCAQTQARHASMQEPDCASLIWDAYRALQERRPEDLYTCARGALRRLQTHSHPQPFPLRNLDLLLFDAARHRCHFDLATLVSIRGEISPEIIRFYMDAATDYPGAGKWITSWLLNHADLHARLSAVDNEDAHRQAASVLLAEAGKCITQLPPPTQPRHHADVLWLQSRLYYVEALIVSDDTRRESCWDQMLHCIESALLATDDWRWWCAYYLEHLSRAIRRSTTTRARFLLLRAEDALSRRFGDSQEWPPDAAVPLALCVTKYAARLGDSPVDQLAELKRATSLIRVDDVPFDLASSVAFVYRSLANNLLRSDRGAADAYLDAGIGLMQRALQNYESADAWVTLLKLARRRYRVRLFARWRDTHTTRRLRQPRAGSRGPRENLSGVPEREERRATLGALMKRCREFTSRESALRSRDMGILLRYLYTWQFEEEGSIVVRADAACAAAGREYQTLKAQEKAFWLRQTAERRLRNVDWVATTFPSLDSARFDLLWMLSQYERLVGMQHRSPASSDAASGRSTGALYYSKHGLPSLHGAHKYGVRRHITSLDVAQYIEHRWPHRPRTLLECGRYYDYIWRYADAIRVLDRCIMLQLRDGTSKRQEVEGIGSTRLDDISITNAAADKLRVHAAILLTEVLLVVAIHSTRPLMLDEEHTRTLTRCDALEWAMRVCGTLQQLPFHSTTKRQFGYVLDRLGVELAGDARSQSAPHRLVKRERMPVELLATYDALVERAESLSQSTRLFEERVGCDPSTMWTSLARHAIKRREKYATVKMRARLEARSREPLKKPTSMPAGILPESVLKHFRENPLDEQALRQLGELMMRSAQCMLRSAPSDDEAKRGALRAQRVAVCKHAYLAFYMIGCLQRSNPPFRERAPNLFMRGLIILWTCRAGGDFACFGSELLDYHSERDDDDPHADHELTWPVVAIRCFRRAEGRAVGGFRTLCRRYRYAAERAKSGGPKSVVLPEVDLNTVCES